jgi:hypothetical protein
MKKIGKGIGPLGVSWAQMGLGIGKFAKNEFDSLGVWFKEFDFKHKEIKFKPSFRLFSTKGLSPKDLDSK